MLRICVLVLMFLPAALLAGTGDLPAMVDLLVKVADDTRGVAEESLVAALRRAPDRDAAAGQRGTLGPITIASGGTLNLQAAGTVQA